ncbi:MAG: hypothetical protein R2764_01530 [Bacteroidales bacterium]
MKNITFTKGSGGLARSLPGEDHYSGLLYYALYGTTPLSGWSFGTTKLITSLESLESNNVLETTSGFEILHYHVKEFFRINPKGILYVTHRYWLRITLRPILRT